MTDTSFLHTPALPDLRGQAPALLGRRAALTMMRHQRDGAGSGTLPQVVALAAAAGTGLAGTALGAGPGLSGLATGALGGLLMGLGGLLAGAALHRPTSRAAYLTTAAALAGLGLTLILILAPAWPWAAAALAVALGAAWTGWRAKRDLLTQQVLAHSLADAQTDLDRDTQAFKSRLEDLRTETDAEIAALYRQAGLDQHLSESPQT